MRWGLLALVLLLGGCDSHDHKPITSVWDIIPDPSPMPPAVVPVKVKPPKPPKPEPKPKPPKPPKPPKGGKK